MRALSLPSPLPPTFGAILIAVCGAEWTLNAAKVTTISDAIALFASPLSSPLLLLPLSCSCFPFGFLFGFYVHVVHLINCLFINSVLESIVCNLFCRCLRLWSEAIIVSPAIYLLIIYLYTFGENKNNNKTSHKNTFLLIIFVWFIWRRERFRTIWSICANWQGFRALWQEQNAYVERIRDGRLYRFYFS